MRTLVFIATAVFAASGCGSTANLDSFAPDEPVSVDAQLLEWGGKLSDLGKDGLAVGVQNDDENLYVSLSTRDPRTIGRIMQSGMTLWIDPAGGKAETFGVRYPLGIARGEDDALGEGLAANRVRIDQSTQELEIVGENGRSVRHDKDAVPGLSVAVEADRSVLTYELQIPLRIREGILYAARVEPGNTIGIGLTTPDPMETHAGEQLGSGGLPGGRMSSADGRGYRGSMPGGFSIEPLDRWISVTLEP